MNWRFTVPLMLATTIFLSPCIGLGQDYIDFETLPDGTPTTDTMTVFDQYSNPVGVGYAGVRFYLSDDGINPNGNYPFIAKVGDPIVGFYGDTTTCPACGVDTVTVSDMPAEIYQDLVGCSFLTCGALQNSAYLIIEYEDTVLEAGGYVLDLETIPTTTEQVTLTTYLGAAQVGSPLIMTGGDPATGNGVATQFSISEPSGFDKLVIYYVNSNPGCNAGLAFDNFYTSSLPPAVCDTIADAIFCEDFEDGTFDQWNAVLGNWEVLSDGASLLAHVEASSVAFRRIVSVDSLPDGIAIDGLVMGNSDGTDTADVSIGFYANDDASSCYLVNLGRGPNEGDRLAICDLDGGVSNELSTNWDVMSVHNVWYHVRIQIWNGHIVAKRWSIEEPEPSEWQVAHSGALDYGGHLMLGLIQGWDAGEEAWFDNLVVSQLPDADGDGVPDTFDNCPTVYNPEQEDWDLDGIGDSCDADEPVGRILVYGTYDGSGYPYDTTSYDGNLVTTLVNHAYSVVVTDRTSTPELTEAVLQGFDELWVFETDSDSGPGCFSTQEQSDIASFRSAGNGLLIVADHKDNGGFNYDWSNDVNLLAEPLGVTFYGRVDHGPECEPIVIDFGGHALGAGADSVCGHSSEALVTVSAPASSIGTYLGDTLVMVVDDGSGRAVLDVSIGRFLDENEGSDYPDCHPNSVALTEQYIVNIANWLMGDTGTCIDYDGDGYGDPQYPDNTCPDDNCWTIYNPDQTDSDGDGVGDACDSNKGITLDHTEGAIEDVITTDYPVTFFLRYSNFSNDTITGVTNGYRIHSPTGADWGTTTVDTVFGDWGTLFDGNTTFGLFGVDGTNADTVTVGAFSLFSTGMLPGYDEVSAKITVGPISQTYDGGELCIDSSWYPPENSWLWATPLFTAPPDWSGPHCFTISSDPDNDGIPSDQDNCPLTYNPDQLDADGDGAGNECDNCPSVSNPDQSDPDNDGYGDLCDNCPETYDPLQTDTDADDLGDVCDECPNDPLNDVDQDEVCGDVDNCPEDYNPGQEDSNGNGIGDVCESCCVEPIRGNVNGDAGEAINIEDLTYLVAYLFSGGPEPPCRDEANVDGSPDDAINIGDLTYLVGYLFNGGPQPPVCP